MAQQVDIFLCKVQAAQYLARHLGANAVVLEGCRVGKGAVVAAGAVVVSDVAPNTVVAGVPARVLKDKDGKTAEKTALIDALRAL